MKDEPSFLKKMKIVIDGRLWSESGIGRYLRNLTYQLQIIDSENEYFVLLLRKDFNQIKFADNFKKIIADFPWYSLAEQYHLPKILDQLKPDLVHFPHFNVPIFFHGNYVVTIHDLIHQHFKTRTVTTRNPLVFQIKKFGYNQVFKNTVENSQFIITPSGFVKKQLQKEWAVDDHKIAVTPEGVDDAILDLNSKITEKEINKVLQKYNITKPYLFYIGNAQPHKNIGNLIAAFKLIKQKNSNISLVLSGPENHFWEKIKRATAEEDIIFTGFITDREMVALYKSAGCFVMPSLEEGFGIPLLEAMACGCPVASSNAGSLPEVGGDAAFYFDPTNVENMAEKINKILEDGKLRQSLTSKGQKRHQNFSWKKMAEQTLSIYKVSVR